MQFIIDFAYIVRQISAFSYILHFINDDAHNIISKRGIEILNNTTKYSYNEIKLSKEKNKKNCFKNS